MKLFYVVCLKEFEGRRVKAQFTHQHVHANSPGEAVEAVWPKAIDAPVGGKVHVYDLSQDALCAGRLDLNTCPREEFVFP